MQESHDGRRSFNSGMKKSFAQDRQEGISDVIVNALRNNMKMEDIQNSVFMV